MFNLGSNRKKIQNLEAKIEHLQEMIDVKERENSKRLEELEEKFTNQVKQSDNLSKANVSSEGSSFEKAQKFGEAILSEVPLQYKVMGAAALAIPVVLTSLDIHVCEALSSSLGFGSDSDDDGDVYPYPDYGVW